ncbi:MAG: hypothetical protein QXL57_03525 [Candidatus Bathyarchaeia archaeon]
MLTKFRHCHNEVKERTLLSKDIKYLKKMRIIKIARIEKGRGLPKKYYTLNLDVVLNVLGQGRIKGAEKQIIIEGCKAASKMINALKIRNSSKLDTQIILKAPFIATLHMGEMVRSPPLIKLPQYPLGSESTRNEERDYYKAEIGEDSANWFWNDEKWSSFEKAVKKFVTERDVKVFYDAISEIPNGDLESCLKVLSKFSSKFHEPLKVIIDIFSRAC